MPLTRKPDWPARLSAYVRDRADTPFAYGSHDCGLFAAGAIAAMTGVDVADFLRGRYRTKLGAARVLRGTTEDASALSIARFLAAYYAIAEIAPAFAGRGDVVLADGSLGVVALHGTDILGPGERGLVRYPLTNATAAWRI